jgi:hypothetical protein
MQAIVSENFDISLVNFGNVKKQENGSFVNIYYKNKRENINQILYLQTPLLDTFGMSLPYHKKDINVQQVKEEMEKYILTLILNDNTEFINVLNQLQEKIKNDLAEKHYKTWLNNTNEKLDKLSIDIRTLMIEQKILKQLYKTNSNQSKQNLITMNCKMLKNENGNWCFDTNCLEENTNDIMKENGNYKSYDPLDLLYVEGVRKKLPKVYCIFTISIWIINDNIYLSPNVNRLLLKPVKTIVPKVMFDLNAIQTK